MPIIVTDAGFDSCDDKTDWHSPATLAEAPDPSNGYQLDLPTTTDSQSLEDSLGKITAIRVTFPSFADGRGFTLARQLRLMGFKGHLRARGHVLADQYAMARRAGFDAVEIDDELAARQPQAQWLARANWQNHNYQSRLR